MSRFRTVPWVMVLQAGVVLSQHWRNLAPGERERLTNLIRSSRGRPGNLSPRERDEVRDLLRKLDLPAAGRKMLPFARRRFRG